MRGVGLIAGLDLVTDKVARTPIASMEPVERHVREAGLVLRLIGNRITFSPPVIIDESGVDEMLARLARALDGVEKELKL